MKYKFTILLLTLFVSFNLWGEVLAFGEITEQVTWCTKPYMWHNDYYTKAGTYYDTISDGNRYKLVLDFSDDGSATRYVSREIKEGEYFMWRGEKITEAGHYKFTYKEDPCEVEETLIVKKAGTNIVHSYDTAIYCKKTSFEWKGQIISRSGDYTHTVSKGEIDSVYHFHVLMSTVPQYKDTLVVKVCQKSYTWRKHVYDQSGWYTEEVHNDHGCDSIFNLNLSLGDSVIRTITHDVCAGTEYKFNGQYYIGDNTFVVRGQTTQGCDSVVTHVYKTIPGTTIIETDTFRVENRSYSWNRFPDHAKYKAGGLYFDNTTVKRSAFGCDTLYKLRLIPVKTVNYVKNTYDGDDKLELTIIDKGKRKTVTLTQDATIREQISLVDGIDSITYHKVHFQAGKLIDRGSLVLCADQVPYEWTYSQSLPPRVINKFELKPYQFTKITQYNDDKTKDSCFTVNIKYCSVVAIDSLVYGYQTLRTKWITRSGQTHIINFFTLKDSLICDTLLASTGCDSVYTNTRFICTDTITHSPGKYYMCGPKSIDGIKFDTTGILFQTIYKDQATQRWVVHEFDLEANQVDTMSPSPKLYGCSLSDNPEPLIDSIYHTTPKSYYESQIDEIHVKHKSIGSTDCDSLIVNLMVTLRRPIKDTTVEYCEDSIILPLSGRIVKNQPYNARARYDDTLHREIECDSITRYTLIHRETKIVMDTNYLDIGGTILWRYDHLHPERVDTITEACEKEFRSTTLYGCDSIAKLVVRDVGYDTSVVTICESEKPYLWHGVAYNETGEYDIRTPKGDSALSLHLTINPTARTYNAIPLFGKDSFYVKGAYHRYDPNNSSKNVFIDTLRQYNGCDSLVTFELTAAKVQLDTTDTCYGTTIKGITLTQDMEIKDTLKSRISLTDSIVLHLYRVHQQDTVFRKWNLMYQDTFTWHGHKIDHIGKFHFDSISQYGCDSVTCLIVSNCVPIMCPPDTLHPCESDRIIINRKVVTKDGNYLDTLLTPTFCDSIVPKRIEFIRKKVIHNSEVLYPGDTILWRGRVFTTVGYKANDVDTIYSTINPTCIDTVYCLTVRAAEILEETVQIYKGNDEVDLPYSHNGKGEYYESQMFIDTLKYKTIGRLYGRDSLYIYTYYTVVDRCSLINDTICEGETYTTPSGLRIDSTGYYVIHTFTATMQDSLARYQIVVLPAEREIVDPALTTGCDSITFRGKTYYSRGVDQPYQVEQRYPGAATNGCDSIYHLTIRVTSLKKTYINVNFPQGEKFKYNGKEYTESTLDTFSYHHERTCDSVIYLRTNFYGPDNNIFLCRGDSVYIRGRWVKPYKSTDVSDTTHNRYFYTDTITYDRTRIVVSDKFDISHNRQKSDSVVPSSKAISFKVCYPVKGDNYPTHYAITFDKSDKGLEAYPMDTVCVKTDRTDKFTIPMELKSGDCIYPAHYKFEIRFYSSGCEGSDTTFTDSVLVRYPSYIMKAKWDNMVFIGLTTDDPDKCQWDLEPPFTWYVNNQLVESEHNPTEPALVYSKLRNNDKIVVYAQRRNYHVSIPSEPYKFHPNKQTGNSPYIIVTPTSVATDEVVNIDAEENGEYQVYNQTGSRCAKGDIHAGSNTINMPGAPGCYLLHVTLQDGTSATERLIVY